MKKTILFIITLSFWLGVVTCASARIEIPFHGELDLERKVLIVYLSQKHADVVTAKVMKVSPNQFDVQVKVDGLQTPCCAIKSDLEGNVDLAHERIDHTQSIKIDLRSGFTLINQKPLNEVIGDFEFLKNRLYVNKLSLGSVAAKGVIDFEDQSILDSSLELISVDLNHVFEFSDYFLGKPLPANGYLSGQVKLSGPFNRLKAQGDVSTFNGHLGSFEYDRVSFEFDGTYPEFKVFNSQLAKSDGFSFTVDGTVNLSKKIDLITQFEGLNKDALVAEYGEQVNWILRRENSSVTGKSSERMEYFFSKGDDVGHDEDFGMIGMEKKIGF